MTFMNKEKLNKVFKDIRNLKQCDGFDPDCFECIINRDLNEVLDILVPAFESALERIKSGDHLAIKDVFIMGMSTAFRYVNYTEVEKHNIQ